MLFGSLILRAQAFLGTFSGNSEASPQKKMMIKETIPDPPLLSPQLCRLSGGRGFFPDHAKTALLSPPNPAGSRMETWNNRQSHPQHTAPPIELAPSPSS